MTTKSYLFMFIAFATFSIGEVISKFYALNKTWYNFLIAFVCYMPAIGFWLHMMGLKNSLTRMSVLWAAGTTLLSVFVGMLFFKECITANQGVGLILAAMSLILIWR